MGWHIILQPNKQFSIWSTIVDDFVHGDSKEQLNYFLKACVGKTIDGINDLLDTHYEDWLYNGEEELRMAILHYTLATLGIEKNTEMHGNIENVLKENNYI